MTFDHYYASVKQRELAEFSFGIKKEKSEKRPNKQMTGAKLTSKSIEQMFTAI